MNKPTITPEESKTVSNIVDHSLSTVLAEVFKHMGIDVLGNPAKLSGAVMDLSESESPSVRVFLRNCDKDLLLPYRDALGIKTAEAFDDAMHRTFLLLRDDRCVDQGYAQSVAGDIAAAVTQAMGIAYTPRNVAMSAGGGDETMPMPVISPAAEHTPPVTYPARPVEERPTQQYSPSQYGPGQYNPGQYPNQYVTAPAPEPARKGGNGLTVVLAVLVVALCAVLALLLNPLGWMRSGADSGSGNVSSADSGSSTDYSSSSSGGSEEESGSAFDAVPSAETGSDGYILPYSDSHLYTYDELDGLSDLDLWYARNEIYARNGYRSSNDELYSYYATKSWYRPLYDKSNWGQDKSHLSSTELDNVNTISRLEKDRNSPYRVGD